MTNPTSAAAIEVFEQLIRDWDRALADNDVERIASFATPDWTFLSQDGVTPGHQFLDSVARGTVLHDTMSSRVISVRVFGDVAIVVARVTNSGTFAGQRFENDEWTSDVFARRDGRWLCELTHLTTARGPAATDSPTA